MENFVLYDEIGKANEQTIYKARRKGTIKYLAISCAERYRRPLISNHVRFVHVLKHPNILQFHEWYETSNHLWLVMELCTGGSLEQVIKEDKFLPDNLVRQFGADIVRGLDYVHSRGVIFDEMRPSRFLLDGNGNVKLFDFSLAHLENECLDEVITRFADEEEFSHTSNNLDLKNVSAYTAPEVLISGQSTAESDYWGLGCLLYHMSCGIPPFSGDSTEQVCHIVLLFVFLSNQLTDNILNSDYAPPKLPGKKLPADFLSLLNALLIKSPANRISPIQVIKHSFWRDRLQDINSSSSLTEQVLTDGSTTTSLLDKRNVMNDEETNLVNGTKHSLDANDKLSTTVSRTNGCKPIDSHKNQDTLVDPDKKADLLSLDTVTCNLHVEAANFTLHANTNVSPSTTQPVPDLEKLVDDSSFMVDTKSTCGMNGRMVQSEYHTPNKAADKDELTSSFYQPRGQSQMDSSQTESTNLHDVLDSKFIPRPVALDTRANLAMVYPWGDDSPSLPHEPKLMLFLWHYLRGSQTEPMNTKQRPSIGSVNCASVSWTPRPLSDYTRWCRAPPPARIEGLVHALNESKLRSITATQLEKHLGDVLALFHSAASDLQETGASSRQLRTPSTTMRSSVRQSRSSLLAYLIWLIASTTVNVGRATLNDGTTLSNRPDFNKLLGVTIIPDLLAELVVQLRASVSASIEFRVGLCQLGSLLAHRMATIAFQQSLDDATENLFAISWKPVTSALPNYLTVLIEILREPVSRTGARLRQVALFAVGEILTCSICLLNRAIKRAKATGVKGNIVEIQASQWQTVVHHLLRCLNTSSGTTTVPPSAIDVPSTLSNLDSDSPNKAHTVANDGNPSSEQPVFRVTEMHVRLSAARSLDAFVTSILGCRLYDLSVTGSLSVTATACINAIATAEVVSRLWTDGLLDANTGQKATPATQRSSLHQEISLSCASALAGIIRINPGLFTSGLIDRVGTTAFTTLLEPPAGGLACQQTNLVARLLSIAATGLLTPLASRLPKTNLPKSNRQAGPHVLSRQTSSPTVGAGTPAACRRMLSEQRFMIAVFRHLKSPHAMLRSKAYLLCSGILSTSPKESFPAAFDAQLPSYLERDLKATRSLQTRYSDLQSMSTMTISTTDTSGSASMAYLAACTLHFADLLVTHLIPLICQQLLISLGCISGSATQSRTSGTSSARKSSRSNSLNQASSTSSLTTMVSIPNLTAARTWLPAFSCLPSLLSTCTTVRVQLVLPDNTEKPSEFCLLVFLGKLLDLWASVDPISSAAAVAGVHQPGNVENQLLAITLTITEDLSQHPESVEARRRDFICLVLPGLARLAVAPRARPETRAICVKIVAKLAEVLLGESDYSASTHSLANFDQPHPSRVRRLSFAPESSLSALAERPLSADVELLLKELDYMEPATRERAISVTEISQKMPADSMTQSHYGFSQSPTQGPEGSSIKRSEMGHRSARRSEKRSMVGTIGAALQAPTPDTLVSLFEVVNKLMIPYADRLIHCSEVTAPTAFIHLINSLLNAVPPTDVCNQPATVFHCPTAEGDCLPASEPELSHALAARTLVVNLVGHGLDVAIVRLLASQLLSPVELDVNVPKSGAVGMRVHGSVASALCLSLFHTITLLLRWPNEAKPSHLIIELRLLELVVIACLELGELLFPSCSKDGNEQPIVRGSENPTSPRTAKKTVPKHSPSKINSRSPPSTVSANLAGRKPPISRLHVASKNLHAPLLAGLEAMNALLAHVANVVRIALAARATNTPEGDKTAMAAEEILIASRPPPALAGLLARLIGLWRPTAVSGDGSLCTSQTSITENHVQSEILIEDEINLQLCEASITALTNFASLYGGEYSRSALTPSAAASISLGLLRLAEEDRKSQEERCASSCSSRSTRLPNSSTDNRTIDSNKKVYQARRRMRLLLRIIRRLISSDTVCRSRLAAEALEQGVTNLYTTLHFLLQKTQRNADASTAKLLREIIDYVSPADRLELNSNTVNNLGPTRSGHNKATNASTSRLGSTAVA
ncbi:Serine/threonine-protein kinase ULK4 [Paragonimus heterotremus]|uniref:Serine/threonine-protein kinase ULK4 n=1 Tax=Paragonimus heterotremus TaxID=100268 RepID=A0A8J4TC00_9TREM|nr:Serine/threonine-protein kinase ULK4 [Paragonimus heterotremus]